MNTDDYTASIIRARGSAMTYDPFYRLCKFECPAFAYDITVNLNFFREFDVWIDLQTQIKRNLEV